MLEFGKRLFSLFLMRLTFIHGAFSLLKLLGTVLAHLGKQRPASKRALDTSQHSVLDEAAHHDPSPRRMNFALALVQQVRHVLRLLQ